MSHENGAPGRGALLRAAGTLVLPAVLAGCAATASGAVAAGPDQPGFWLGLWHGLIAPAPGRSRLTRWRIARRTRYPVSGNVA